MPRHARLTARQWDRIRPLLPSSAGRRGRPWADHRRIVEAIVCRYRTGIPCQDLPARFGSWKTVWARHRRWAADGTWDRVLGVLLARANDDGPIDWQVAVDSTITRAHQHAANTRRPEKCRAAARGQGLDAHRAPAGHADRLFPRRSDHEDPPHRGRSGPTAGRPHDARAGARRPVPAVAAGRPASARTPGGASGPAVGRAPR
ncbi:IS5 family transposase [Streptomyces sp. PR69]|uniref:IS5 family transposase n=1 Tax=Streptomyces sp. PR69 TaxID=2984950 RepID=UPI003A5BF569